MIEVLLYGYLAGWVLTTLGLAFSADRIQDPHSPQRHPLALAAGAAWPVLLLGVAEYAAVAAAAAVVHDEDRELLVKL
ncbi:MAG: hypothetical protein ACRDUX_25620 [Mycobacterium sp.]